MTDDEAVRIEHGYHIIDAAAWVRQRTSPPLAGLTTQLSEFVRHPLFAETHNSMDTTGRMQLWCAARGWTTKEATHYLDHNSLSEPIRVVLATDADRSAYALVQIGSDAPRVFGDLTTADAYWQQVEPVDIVCPASHRWTWLDHTCLLDHCGNDIAFTALFGPTPGEPYSRCRDCTAYNDGDRDTPCLCDGRDVIYCPTCDRKCRLQLTAVPTIVFRDEQ